MRIHNIMKCGVAVAALTMLTAAYGENAKTTERLTYSQDVASILNSKCVRCHAPGQTAPMSLRTYKEVRPWVKSIEKNVAERLMPPWHADSEFGHFSNDRSLSEKEVDTIVSWARQGAKQGPKKDTPPLAPIPTGDWQLGEPDLIIEFERVDLAKGGPDVFKNLMVDPGIDEDVWVRAIEILPGNRKIVHHVIAFAMDGRSKGRPNWLGGWAAGLDPMDFPEGTGRLLSKDAMLVGDMHYHPAEDSEEWDVTRVGLYLAEESKIEKELVNLWVDNESFAIPAGDPNYEVTSSFTFGQDSRILGLLPHMHYRGKDFKYTATYPDGREDILLQVSKYDFNWQTNYVLAEPITVPKGTTINCIAHFDNSADNEANPDPTKIVTFGPQSFDEMMIGFVDYVVVDGLRPDFLEPVERIAIQVPPAILERYEGTYSLTPEMDFVIALQGEQLMVEVEGQGTFPIFAETETKFYFTITEAQMQFNVDENGAVDSLLFSQNGQNITANRK